MKKIFLLTVCLCSFAAFAAPIVKNGEKIAFLGDSITQFGDRPDGYVRLVMDGLKRAGVNAVALPAGVSGNKSNDMLRRLPGVLEKKPDWLLLSCGVNDVGHGKNGVELPDFKKNISAILDQAKAAGVKVMILTPTTHTEQVDSANNRKLAGYCEFLRKEAADRKLLLADLNRKMQDELIAKKNVRGLKLTIDNLHMNGYGNQMMAAGVLEAFGVTPAEIDGFRKEWNKIPSMAPILNSPHSPSFLISIDDYEVLRAEAGKKGLAPEEFARQVIVERIRQTKKP
ncbi:MAG: Esterase TesA precursor [Lentisphaerae bacterium ADurb.Bin242]|nr:MAG: Esterase TesA precursor [Lentisphaerae bacterium ADurb.Bin242]